MHMSQYNPITICTFSTCKHPCNTVSTPKIVVILQALELSNLKAVLILYMLHIFFTPSNDTHKRHNTCSKRLAYPQAPTIPSHTPFWGYVRCCFLKHRRSISLCPSDSCVVNHIHTAVLTWFSQTLTVKREVDSTTRVWHAKQIFFIVSYSCLSMK